MRDFQVFLQKGCLIGYFFAKLLENKFNRNSPVYRVVTTYVVKTKTVNVLVLSVLDLNSLLHNVNSLFFFQTVTTVLKVLLECISMKLSGRTYLFQPQHAFLRKGSKAVCPMS